MTPNQALRRLETALQEAAAESDFAPTVRVSIEIKDGKATATLAASVMFKNRADKYGYSNEGVEGLDWDETMAELAHRRDRHVAVFTKVIAAPKNEVVDAEEMPF